MRSQPLPDETTDQVSRLRPDGTVFPPVTPDPPLPPGYVSPLEVSPLLADLLSESGERRVVG